jgi:hypothetical protein
MTSQLGEISGSNSGEYEDICHLGYCVVETGTSLPMFQRCLLLLSSGRFWQWQQAPLKLGYTSTRLNGDTSQKTDTVMLQTSYKDFKVVCSDVQGRLRMCKHTHYDKNVKLSTALRLMAKINNNNNADNVMMKTSLCQNYFNCTSDLQSLSFLHRILQSTVMMMIMIMMIILN